MTHRDRTNGARSQAALLVGLATALLWSGTGCTGHGHGAHGGGHRLPNVKEYVQLLDRPERAEYQKPDQVVQALELRPGMAVADLGAGSGYFTWRFAQALGGSGKVFAIDIEPELEGYIKAAVARASSPAPVQFVLAAADDPKLPPQSVDLIFVCNAFHHLPDRSAYFARLARALKPGGRVAIVDFYPDERSGDLGFPKDHLVPEETTLEELRRAGYVLRREHTFLPKQYFLEFVPAGS